MSTAQNPYEQASIPDERTVFREQEAKTSLLGKIKGILGIKTGSTKEEKPEDSLKVMLEDAREHIRYLIESGVKVTPEEAKDVQLIIAALQDPNSIKQDLSSELLAALAGLSGKVRPVTAESLRLCSGSTQAILRYYWIFTVILALIIGAGSVLSFITAGISKSIAANTDSANAVVVTLVSQIAGDASRPSATTSPGGSAVTSQPSVSRVGLADLQALAGTTRAIYQQAILLDTLNFIPLFRAENPAIPKADLQLPVPLNDPPASAAKMIRVYQDVRTFAGMVRCYTELFYGAIGTIILPILYALLGASAYLLRLFSKQVRERSYLPSYADYAHLLVAGIGGTVVGLFNNFVIGGGVSLSPLAVAFLVGYAADFFFTFLDNFLRARGSRPAGDGTTPNKPD